MNLIEKIKLNFSFIWKGNKKIKQTGGLQVNQEPGGITNIFHLENVTVTSIEELAGLSAAQDSDALIKTMGERFLIEQSVKQENFKAIVCKAELSTIANPQPIEPDWFLKWMKISEGVSREKVQDILAKILSSEVKKSGSFSLRTLEVLKNLSREELILFQNFCDISYSVPLLGDALTAVISEPFGSPGNNGMISLGLAYPNLAILQDAGLIQTDLNAWRQLPVPTMLAMPFTIGPDAFILKPTNETVASAPKVAIINFTAAGLELRSVLTLRTNLEYEEKFLEWVKDKWKMVQ